MLDKIHLGDCLEVMQSIPDKSVDMVLCDLPYGTTACAWDTIIPFNALWAAYGRIARDRAAIVLTASNPFSSALVMSNISQYRHEWIWDKALPSGFHLAKHRPMQRHEHILVFSKKSPMYCPLMELYPKKRMVGGRIGSDSNPIKGIHHDVPREVFEKYPQSILEYYKRDKGTFHPTQKPVNLFSYLIRTYTKGGDTVLDNCIGSGTTAVAAIKTGRHYIGIEKDPDIYKVACNRIAAGRRWHGPRVVEEPKGFGLNV